MGFRSTMGETLSVKPYLPFGELVTKEIKMSLLPSVSNIWIHRGTPQSCIIYKHFQVGERKGWNVGDEKDWCYWKFNEVHSKMNLKGNLFERSRTSLVLSRRFYSFKGQVYLILKDIFWLKWGRTGRT